MALGRYSTREFVPTEPSHFPLPDLTDANAPRGGSEGGAGQAKCPPRLCPSRAKGAAFRSRHASVGCLTHAGPPRRGPRACFASSPAGQGGASGAPVPLPWPPSLPPCLGATSRDASRGADPAVNSSFWIRRNFPLQSALLGAGVLLISQGWRQSTATPFSYPIQLSGFPGAFRPVR